MRDRFLMRPSTLSSCRYPASLRQVLRTSVPPHGILKPKLDPSCHPRSGDIAEASEMLQQRLSRAMSGLGRSGLSGADFAVLQDTENRGAAISMPARYHPGDLCRVEFDQHDFVPSVLIPSNVRNRRKTGVHEEGIARFVIHDQLCLLIPPPAVAKWLRLRKTESAEERINPT
jgi:hypothetical protein